MLRKNKAFTLVELIVVITILAILGTIAFLSLQGYSRDARDSVRISDLNNISRGMEFMLTKAGRLPVPDDNVEITASGTTILYQGYAGENVLGIIGVNNGGKDPKDNTFYTYSSNSNYNKYQLLGFLENGDQIGLLNNNSVNADLSNRSPVSKGYKLGIITDPINKQPIQLIGTGVDITNTMLNLAIYIDNSDDGLILGNGGSLNYITPNSSCKRILELNIRSKSGMYMLDLTGKGTSIEVFCDMKTNGGGRTKVSMLAFNAIISRGEYIELFREDKDFSGSGYTLNIDKLDYTDFVYLTDNYKGNVELLSNGSIKTVGTVSEGLGEWISAYSYDVMSPFYRQEWYYYTDIEKSNKETVTVGSNFVSTPSGFRNFIYERLISGNNGVGMPTWNATNFPYGKRGLGGNWCYGGKNGCWRDLGQERASLWLR